MIRSRERTISLSVISPLSNISETCNTWGRAYNICKILSGDESYVAFS